VVAGTTSGIGTGLLPSANNVAVNWQKAGMQSVGVIPNRAAVCATVNPIGDGSDDAPNINTAITNCTAGQVVQLGAGTFGVYSQASGHSPINLNKGVTLRGTGTCTNASTPYCSTVINLADGTIPFGTTCGSQNACDNNNAPAIVAGVSQQYLRWSNCDAGSTLNCSSAISVAADLAQGATSVQVASTSVFQVGMWVLIDEQSGAGFVTDPLGHGQVWAASDAMNSTSSPATGRVIWELHNPGISSDDFASGTNPQTPNTAGCWFDFCDRPTAEIQTMSRALLKMRSGRCNVYSTSSCCFVKHLFV
jgi:hypothetical protein